MDSYLQFASNLNTAEDVDDAWQIGIDYFAQFSATHIGFTEQHVSDGALIRWTTPDWIVDAFLEDATPENDPMGEHSKNNVTPYFFGEDFEGQHEKLAPARIRFLDHMKAVDIKHGVAFPTSVTSKINWSYFGFATTLNSDEFTKLFNAYGQEIALGGFMLKNVIDTHIRRKEKLSPLLSAREKECLLWLSKGYRNDRIADILGVKAVTIEFHFQNCRRKLGATTREQALAIAVSNGIIAP